MAILGVDVSSYNRSDLSYFEHLHHYGVKFVFVKLTEGTGWRNASAGEQIRHAFDAKIGVVGGYHFFHGNGKAEARQFLANVKLLGLNKNTPLMIDAETADIGGTGNINEFLDYLYAHGYKKLFVYSMLSYFGTYIHLGSLHHGSQWIADYTEYKPNEPHMRIWQFTDNFHGLHTDGNVCYAPDLLGVNSDSNNTTEKVGDSEFYKSGSEFKAKTPINGYKDAGLVHPKYARDAGYKLYAKPVKVGNVYRLKTSYGTYYSANTKYVEKIK